MTPRMQYCTRAAAVLPLIAALALMTGCGSSDDAPTSTAPATATRSAAGVTCPSREGTSKGTARNAMFAFRNLTTVDVVYRASPPDCTKWWGTEYPANFNGTEIPSMLASDPAVTMLLQPDPGAGNVRTNISLARINGDVVATFVAALNWRTEVMTVESLTGPTAVAVSVSTARRKYTTQYTFTLRK